MTEQLARTRHLVGTTAEWAAVNPFVVAAGEIAIEIKTDQSRWIKIGDGVTTFANLEYLFDFSASPTFQNLTITGLLEAGQIEADVSGSLYIKVKNTDTETLAKGTPFYISGTASGGETVEVKKAMASDTAKGPAIGLIADSLSVNAEGNGILVGQITGYNTVFPGWQANQALYVGQSGGLTSSEPGGYKQIVARVGRVNGSTGTLIVSGSSSSGGSGSSTLYTVGPLSRNNGVTTVGTQLREISNNTSLVASTGQVDANTAPTQFAVKEFTGSRYVTNVTSESGQPFSVSGIATKDGNGDWTFVRNISLSMNVANGLARLDSDGKIPTSLLPTSAIPTNSDAIAEGTSNLYFTQARARNAISASGDLTYDPNTGVISFSSSVAITSISGVAPISVTSGSTPVVSISAATTSAAGSMSGADKVKLNGIETGAQVNVPTNLTWSGSNRTIESSTGSDAQIPLFGSTLAGLTPASGGGTTNFLRADGAWAAPASSGVSSVGATAPISSTGGATPTISISAATTSAAGSMSASDKQKLDGIASGAQVNVATNLGYTASTRSLTSSTGTGVTLPLTTAGAPGFAPTLPPSAQTTSFLRGDGTWATPTGTGVTSVGGTAPISSSGGTTPTISVSIATTGAVGVVQLADTAAIAAGTASRVLDAAGAKAAYLPIDLVHGRRNVLANGDFSAWDYGSSITLGSPNSLMGPNRWIIQRDGSGTGVTIAKNINASTLFGGRVPVSFARIQGSSAGAGTTATPLIQRIEGVRTLAQSQATLSFWAKSNSGDNLAIATQIAQDFGVGGSPSSRVATFISSFTVTNAWQYFTATITIPSLVGKTIGNSSDYLELLLQLPADSFDVSISQVQLEAGSIATPFYNYTRTEELSLCERYYQIGSGSLGTYAAAAGFVRVGQVFFRTPMRATPSITITSTNLVNCTTLTAERIDIDSFAVLAFAQAAGRVTADFTYTASAEF